MKRILFPFIFLLPAIVFAAGESAASPTLLEQILPALITIAVPLLISGGKLLIPGLPKWLPPILAPVLGAVLSLLIDLSSGGQVGVIMGAVYGGLGTWLREFIKQLQQASAQ